MKKLNNNSLESSLSSPAASGFVLTMGSSLLIAYILGIPADYTVAVGAAFWLDKYVFNNSIKNVLLRKIN